MTYLNFAPEITRTVDGVEHVAIVCWKCNGTGYLPGYEHSDGARCWGCNAHRGPVGWRTRDEYERILVRREKDRERAERKAREEAERAAREFEEWKTAHPEIVEALAAYDGRSSFLLDLAEKVEVGMTLTESQVEAGMKAISKDREREAGEIEVPEGRQVVEGTVLSLKDYEDTFSPYGGTVWKMVVQADGFRVFGAVPRALLEAGVEKGSRVRFTATLQPKEKGFGFYKRPTKPEILEPVPA